MKCCRRYVSQTFAINTFRFAIFSSKKPFLTRVLIHRKFFNHLVNIFVKKLLIFVSTRSARYYAIELFTHFRSLISVHSFPFTHFCSLTSVTDQVWNQMSHFLSIPNVFVSAIFRLITNWTREMTQPESTNCSRNGTCPVHLPCTCHADVYCLRESTNWTRNTSGKCNAHFLSEKR